VGEWPTRLVRRGQGIIAPGMAFKAVFAQRARSQHRSSSLERSAPAPEQLTGVARSQHRSSSLEHSAPAPEQLTGVATPVNRSYKRLEIKRALDLN